LNNLKHSLKNHKKEIFFFAHFDVSKIVIFCSIEFFWDTLNMRKFIKEKKGFSQIKKNLRQNKRGDFFFPFLPAIFLFLFMHEIFF